MKKNSPDLNAKSRIKKSVKMSGMAFLSGAVVLGSVSFVGLVPASAAVDGPTVGLGTLQSYSVLGGASVSNTGETVLAGDLGVSPGTAITGFPPGITLGTVHQTDAHASQAQSDLVIAYDDAAGRASDATLSADLGGQTLVGGVYTAPSTLDLTGTLTLDGQNNPNSVFIFQVGSALNTATASNINLINGATACNVFWQVGSSATLGTASTFKGNIMALTSISATTTANVEGRALARNGSVTLDTNTFTAPACTNATPVVPPEDATPTEPTTPVDGSIPTEPTTPVDGSIPTEPTTPTDDSTPTDNPSIPTDSSTSTDQPSIPTDSSTNLERTPGDSSTPLTRTTDDSSLTIANTGANGAENSNNLFLMGVSGFMFLVGLLVLSSNRIIARIPHKH